MSVTVNRIVLMLCALVASIIFLISSCRQQQPATGEAALRKWYHAEHDTLMLLLRQMDSLNTSHAPVERLQQQFARCRYRYKHIEGVVEYYFQGLTRRINGPALPDIKTDDNQVWPPHGFQVVEQMVYAPMQDSLRPVLSNEIQLLQTDLEFAAANLAETAILPRHVRELVQHQIIRTGTLGITGMDAPVSQLSLSEAAYALRGLQSLLAAYSGNKDYGKEIRNLFEKAITYATAHTDFVSFNRMVFLRQHLAPLGNALRHFPEAPTAADGQFAKPFDGTLSDLLQGKGFNPDYYTNYAAVGSNAAKIELGEQLFYETCLSKSGGISCATCHQPEKFFTDGLPKAANVVHGGSLPRNTPTLFYTALQRDQFYDHRSSTLEDQVAEVMSSQDEFDLEAKEAASKISLNGDYSRLFTAAFGSSKWSGYEVRNALAAYIRTLNPFASRFDAYMRGNDTALSAQELEGFNVFSGKAKCATCHFIPLFNGTVPPWFTKSESEIIGVPDAAKWNNASIDKDMGRYKWNQLEPLRHAFKTPTVRNSAQTAPYMHNGVYQTLQDVVRFYHKGGGAGIGIDLPYQTLPFDSLRLSTREEDAIIAFLHSLTDIVGNEKR